MKLYIYKIHPKNETEETKCYVGITMYPKKRFCNHRLLYDRWCNQLAPYCTSYELFKIYGKEQLTFSILEEIECDTKEECKMVEYNWIRKMENAVNRSKGYSIEDWRKYNREYKRNMGFYECPNCGCEIKRNSKSMHEKTKKHRKSIDSV